MEPLNTSVRPAGSHLAWWPHVLLLTAAVGWGASISLATIAMGSGHHPLAVSFISSVIAFLGLSLNLMVSRTRPPLDREHLVFYLVCGFIGTAAPGVLTLVAAEHLPAGVRSILFALIPMITLAFMAGLGRERTGIRQFTGLTLGLLSVLVLLRPGSTAVVPAQYIWIGASILTVACYALENVYIDLKRPAGLDPFVALWGMTLAAVLMQVPVVWWLGDAAGPPWGLGKTELAILGMSLLNIVCYGIYILLIARSGPVFASQVSYLTPPTGIAWGVVLLGENVTATIFFSVALVLAGIALVRPRDAAG